MELKLKDRKILYHLSRNSRISYNQLGKLVKMSRNAVKYRVERLKEEKIITNFSTVINIGALDYNSFTMLFKFNKNPYQNPEILDYFKKHPFSIWVVSLSGTFDLYAEFTAKDFRQQNQIVTEIREHFGEDLSHYEIQLLKETLRVEHLIGSIYQDLKVAEVEAEKREFKGIDLDPLDKKILKVISLNSDKSLREIAKEVDSTWDVVRYRLKQMESARVIIKYFPEINLNRLGYAQFLGYLKLHNISPEKMKKLTNIFRSNIQISYAFSGLSNNSVLFHCAFKSVEELDRFLSNLQEDFKENLISIDYYLIKEQLKFDLFPTGLLKED